MPGKDGEGDICPDCQPDDPEDSDPELPEGYDPSEDLHALRAGISRTNRDPAYTRVQLYIVQLQDRIRRTDAAVWGTAFRGDDSPPDDETKD